MRSVPRGGSFASPRKVQSTAPRRTAHLEHSNTLRAAFFSVHAAVRNVFRYLSTSSDNLPVGLFCSIAEQVSLLTELAS
jgi:hypothetical protein